MGDRRINGCLVLSLGAIRLHNHLGNHALELLIRANHVLSLDPVRLLDHRFDFLEHCCVPSLLHLIESNVVLHLLQLTCVIQRRIDLLRIFPDSGGYFSALHLSAVVERDLARDGGTCL